MSENYERLSAQDSTFLYAESPVAHMHIGTVAIFEDSGWSEQALCDHVESRLHLVPRLRKRLQWGPLGQGRPVWVDDLHFDVRLHVRSVGLPEPGDESALLELVGKVMSIPLDRERPLWEIWVCPLVATDQRPARKAVIFKSHHCLVDGVSSVDLGTVVLDFQKDPPPAQPSPVWTPVPGPTKAELWRETLRERAAQPAGLLDAFAQARDKPEQLVQRAGEVLQGLLALGRAALDPAPRTSLTHQIGAYRRFELVRLPLASIKQIKNANQCKVNDVVLALVAGGLRRLLQARGEPTDRLLMRAMVPVSVRDASQRMTYGNRVSMMAAELPVGEPDPAQRLTLVSAQMDGLKESNQAAGADFWLKMSEYTPAALLALGARATAFQRMVNLAVTNVPGPQFPLYMLGGRLLELFPFAPLIGTMSVAVAAASYDGQLGFGLSADWDLVPDLAVFAEGIRASFDELLPGCAT